MSATLAIMAISTAVSAVSAKMEADAQADSLNAEADIIDAEAAETRRLASINALEQEVGRLEEAEAIYGANLAFSAAAGGDSQKSGSVAAVQLQNKKNTKQDLASIRLNQSTAVSGANRQSAVASNLRSAASSTRRIGMFKMITGAGLGAARIARASPGRQPTSGTTEQAFSRGGFFAGSGGTAGGGQFG